MAASTHRAGIDLGDAGRRDLIELIQQDEPLPETIPIKVIDLFGDDTMTLVAVNVG